MLALLASLLLADARVFVVHVYADQAYRAATPDWKKHVEACFRLASSRVAPLGARFVVTGMFPWERDAGDGTLGRAARQLEAINDARYADWVVGFVGGMTVVPVDREAIGLASPLGRHSVQRAALWRWGLSRPWAEALILLHEWGHLMGAIHTEAPSVMSPTLSRAADFDRPNRLLIRLGVRMKPGPERALDARGHRDALADFIRGIDDPAWLRADRHQMLRWLEARR